MIVAIGSDKGLADWNALMIQSRRISQSLDKCQSHSRLSALMTEYNQVYELLQSTGVKFEYRVK